MAEHGDHKSGRDKRVAGKSSASAGRRRTTASVLDDDEEDDATAGRRRTASKAAADDDEEGNEAGARRRTASKAAADDDEGEDDAADGDRRTASKASADDDEEEEGDPEKSAEAPSTRSKGLSGKGLGGKRALCVAINDYHGVENDLPSCIIDATRMKRVLERDFGFEVTTLFDSDATRENVVRELTDLFDDTTESDRIVFYYSGHGYQDVDADGLKQESLVLFDGFFLDDELVELTQDIPAGVLTVVLDSCFSGGLEKVFLKAAALAAHADAGAVAGDGVDKSVVAAAQVALNTAPAFGEIKTFVPPNALTKAAFEQSAPPAKAFRPFGGVTRHRKRGERLVQKDFVLSLPTDEEGEPGLNGLLISACLENEKASASTARTDGMSAFTFAMLQVLADEGQDISTTRLAQAAASVLRSIGIAQTPQVKVPHRPGGMDRLSFIDLQRVGEKTTEPLGAEDAAAHDFQAFVTSRLRQLLQEGGTMNPMIFQGQTQDKFFPGFEQILPVAINLVGELFKEFQPGGAQKGISGGGMAAQDKFFPGFEQVLPVAINLVGSLFKEFQAGGGAQKSVSGGGMAGQDKFFPGFEQVLPVAINLVGSLFKEFQAGGGAQKSVSSGGVAAQEKFFPGFEQVLPVAINLVGSLFKEFQAGGGAQKSVSGGGMAGQDKFFPGFEQVLPVAINLVGSLFKEFQTAGGAQKGVTNGGSAGQDKFFGLEIIIPAAIGLASSLLKEFQPGGSLTGAMGASTAGMRLQ